MNIRIEFRYAVLTALLILLWLLIEYVSGLQDTYIAYHPYVSVLAAIIPIITYRMALTEKIEQKFGKLGFAQAFFSGVLITLFLCVLTIPVQLTFHKFINPDFFSNMIVHAVTVGKQTPEQAALYFNLQSYIIESVLATLAFGLLISLILGLRMRTIK